MNLASPRRTPPDRPWHRLLPRGPLAGSGALEPPIRGELLGSTGFVQLGQELAQAHGAPDPGRRASAFFPRLRQNVAVLHEAHRSIARQEARGSPIGPAGEWLLDNIHLVAAQTREVHDGLPRRFFRRLPVLASPGYAGLPRVYALAWAYATHADSAFALRCQHRQAPSTSPKAALEMACTQDF